ncbi:MAG: sodium/glutamate symporter [Gammaproteobacteria bacterium]|nr:MAG: sodium/glutamate symporter [Gammaproteobacteria bacterium]
MDFINNFLNVGPFRAVTWGIVVLFVGRWLIQRSSFLRDYNIPEPVVGGLLFALISTAVYFLFDVTIQFDLGARDFLLVYFFTTIGLNAKLSDLVSGGKPLAILLAATIGYMFVQNITGITVASAFGLPAQMGLLGGTVSLIGGHGTAIAWAPVFASEYGIANAMEVGIACATFGLVLASTMGGPIAKYLIAKHDLKPTQVEGFDVGVTEEQSHYKVDYMGFLQAIFAIHLSVTLGFVMNEALEAAGLKMPLFVTSLFGGILLANLIPRLMPRAGWPSRTPALALIAEVSLGIFLAMSLMSMQLWSLIELAAPILTMLIAQFVIAAGLTLFLIFRLMGRNYDAAVICSGFGGITLGSTATAMANMTAVTHRYGPSHLAFIIVPLVCAFFIDIVNAFMIQYFLANI